MDHALLAASDELEPLIAAEPQPLPLPGVYQQPARAAVCRGRIDGELLSRQWTRAWLRRDDARIRVVRQQLEHECTPLLQWAHCSWDYLLTTEGCRFLARKPGEKWGARGDYRACEAPDYHRLVTDTFRACAERCVTEPTARPLIAYLADELWPAIRATYQALSQPTDARQRALTAYSYLRCVPYRFLNGYHDMLVRRVLRRLPTPSRRVIELYYLHFFTEDAVTAAMASNRSAVSAYKRQALRRLARADTLTCALLRQLERY